MLPDVNVVAQTLFHLSRSTRDNNGTTHFIDLASMKAMLARKVNVWVMILGI